MRIGNERPQRQTRSSPVVDSCIDADRVFVEVSFNVPSWDDRDHLEARLGWRQPGVATATKNDAARERGRLEPRAIHAPKYTTAPRKRLVRPPRSLTNRKNVA